MDNKIKEFYEEYKTYILFLALWWVWLFVGTCVYTSVLDISIAQGFYQAVNVGYRYTIDSIELKTD
jgi:hypothetical protein